MYTDLLACRQLPIWADISKLWGEAGKGSHRYASTSEPQAVKAVRQYEDVLRNPPQVADATQNCISTATVLRLAAIYFSLS